VEQAEGSRRPIQAHPKDEALVNALIILLHVVQLPTDLLGLAAVRDVLPWWALAGL
jgi:hypothetical protein